MVTKAGVGSLRSGPRCRSLLVFAPLFWKLGAATSGHAIARERDARMHASRTRRSERRARGPFAPAPPFFFAAEFVWFFHFSSLSLSLSFSLLLHAPSPTLFRRLIAPSHPTQVSHAISPRTRDRSRDLGGKTAGAAWRGGAAAPAAAVVSRDLRTRGRQRMIGRRKSAATSTQQLTQEERKKEKEAEG